MAFMKRLLLFVLLLCVSFAASAKETYSYRKLSMRDGLASNVVRNIVQDGYGFMWFGTDNGLCRYDGRSIQNYRIAECGSSQYISALTVSDSCLYIGTTVGAFQFSFADNRFKRLPLDIHSLVRHFAIDHDGQLWIATSGQGVFSYLPKTGQSKHYELENTHGYADFVMADRENKIWTVSNTNLQPVQRLNRLHDNFETAAWTYDGEYNSLCMLQAADGRFYLGTWSEGLLVVNGDGQLQQQLSPKLLGMGSHIHTLSQHADGCIYIGCDDGLLRYNPLTGQTVNMLDDLGIDDRFIYSVATDSEGGVWIGTFYGGVDYFSPVGNRFSVFTTENGLAGNVVSHFCEDNRGNIWMASDDGGLMCFNPQEGRFAGYPHQDVLSGLNVHALSVSDNQLWIGTYTDGIYILDLSTGRLRHYGDSRPCGLDDNSSYAILHDSRHRTWVATMRGFNRYDPVGDNFENLLTLDAITIDMDEDRQGTLWLSTQGNGLWRYWPDSRKSKAYHHDENDIHSLSDEQVNCCLVDAAGILWVGTMSGLCYYDASHDRFERVPITDENLNVVGIVEQAGSLWLSTEHGLFHYEPKESSQAVHHFTQDDGLVSEQFLPNSCLKAADGRLYFGSTIGFNSFFPYNIKINTVEPPVHITSLEMLNRQERTDQGVPVDLSAVSDISFSYSEARMLSFSFASLSYCSPQKNQYAYMLEGFDRDWNEIGSQNKATYTNLSAGTYTLRVKATNNDGIWSTREARLRITVNPPLWWSWWAKLIYALVIVSLFWYYVHLRLRRAERMHQQELKQVREQNEQESREARLSYFTMIAHEIRTPVSLIIAPLEQMKKTLGEAPSHSSSSGLSSLSALNASLQIIDRNAHRLLELVNQLLDFRKVEQRSLVMHFASQNVSELIHSVSERFEPTFRQGGKTFTTAYPPQRFSAIIDREGITKVISNLLTNANKYSKSAAELRCIIDPDESHFQIIVADDGVGIKPEDQERIFAPFYQAEGNKPGTGIGLSIVKSIVDLHHGTIAVASELGKGTTFTVTLPVKQDTDSSATAADGTVQAHDRQLTDDTIPDEQPDEATAANGGGEHRAADGQLYMLIVDDNEDMVQFLADYFRQQYRVLTAFDGVEALSMLSKHQVSIIVSDWMMPRMDGVELCRRVRQNVLTSHIPFLMLTAKTDNRSKIEGMNIGADAYVEKPFSVEFLEACIANILQMRRLLMKKVSTEPWEDLAQIGTTQVDNELLTKMNKLIEDNVSNADLNVNFLASQLNISRSGLFAKIKTLADVTPNEMIQMVRLKRAAQLLSEGRYMVGEIGYMVGFSNPSYFSKCFQKQFGIRPAEYAKSRKGMKGGSK